MSQIPAVGPASAPGSDTDVPLLCSSSDKSVKVWDVGTRTCVHTFFDHQDQVRRPERCPFQSAVPSATC